MSSYKISKDNADINWDHIDKIKKKIKSIIFMARLIDRKNNRNHSKIIFDWSIKYGNYKKSME